MSKLPGLVMPIQEYPELFLDLPSEEVLKSYIEESQEFSQSYELSEFFKSTTDPLTSVEYSDKLHKALVKKYLGDK